jgi:hypothetical protein|tara:strand:- start:833 stop:1756 length:924 start_codon:yes stop_codon:yes gene_type:complete
MYRNFLGLIFISIVCFSPLSIAAIESNDYSFSLLELKKTEAGINVNGQEYIDPSSPIANFSQYSDTGTITYLTPSPENGYDVKMVRPLSDKVPQRFGKIESVDGIWHFIGQDGKHYSGDAFQLVSRGLIMHRGRVFTYLSPDVSPTPHKLPDGFEFAPYQTGDLSFSRHFLLLSKIPPKKHFGFVTLTTISSDYEAAFIDIETGRISSKHVMRIRDKKDNEMEEHLSSIYHVYGAEDGALFVTLDNEYKQLNIRQFQTDKLVTAFERKMGLSFIKSYRKSNGKIYLKASVGFKDQEIDDLEAFVKSS